MGAPSDPEQTPWAALTPRSQQRLTTIMREHVPEVFRANRAIEQQTGYVSEIGRNMMVDVLSHLGTLAVQGDDLDPEQQASQLAKIEEHLRRALIEHPEEVVRNRTAEVAERWSTYQREAMPYREHGTLPNAPRHRELEDLRARIQRQLEAGRSKKPQETTWEETLDAAAEMTEAAALTDELADKLEQCIGAGQERRRADERAAEQRKRGRMTAVRWAVGIAVSVVLASGTYLLGKGAGEPGGEAVPARQAAPTTPPDLP